MREALVHDINACIRNGARSTSAVAMTGPSEAIRLIVVALGPATIAITAERTGDGSGEGCGEACTGDGETADVAFATGFDPIGTAPQADTRKRTTTHRFITCANA